MLLNFGVPRFADDYCRVTFGFDLQQILSAIQSEYVKWTGRFVVMFLSRVTFSLGDTGLFLLNVTNAAFMLIAILTTIKLVPAASRQPTLVFVVLALLIWFTPHRFGEVILWKTGAIQYFWGCVLTLVLFARLHTRKNTHVAVLALLGFFVGAWLENLSAAVWAVLALQLGISWQQTREISRPTMVALTGVSIGLLLLVVAPGNHVRANAIGEHLTLIEDIALTFARLASYAHPLLVGLFALASATSFFLCRKHFKQAMPIALTLIGVGALAVLSLLFAPSASFIGRAAFPLEFFLAVAVTIMLPYELLLMVGKRGASLLSIALVVLGSGYWLNDFRSVYRGYSQLGYLETFRREIIQETQRQNIPPPIPLPQLAFSPDRIVGNTTINEGRYFARDITPQPDHWRNQCYAQAHSAGSVRLVTQAE